MNLVALLVTHVTHEPKMPSARLSQASAQQSEEHSRGATVVVISGDWELLTKAPSSVAGEMLLLRTALTIVALLMIYNKTNIC